MSSQDTFSSIKSFAQKSWRLCATTVTVIAAMFATVKPEVSLTNKASFSWFLVRVYWPEIVICLAALVCGVLVARLRGTKRQADPWKERLRRFRTLWGLTSRVDRVLGVMLIILLLVTTLPLVWHQLGLMLNAQQTFISVRLMNWYGDDLQRTAAYQINQGDYDTAVHMLRLQEKELGDLQEGRTAGDVATNLAGFVSTARQLKTAAQERMRRAGVVRGDLLLLGATDAMLPQGAFGQTIARSSTEAPGASQLRSYRDALNKVAKMCAEGKSAEATAAEVGMAASAMGFARWPAMLFGDSAPLQRRVAILCGILAPLNSQQVNALHEAAFSVSAMAQRMDWREAFDADWITSGPMVLRAFGRAGDTVLQRLFGKGVLAEFLPEARTEREVAAPAQIPNQEAATLVVMKSEREDGKFSYGALTPATYIEAANASKAVTMEARIRRLPSGAVLTLCFAERAGNRSGFFTSSEADGRIRVAKTEACASAAAPDDNIRKVDASMTAAIARLLALADAGRAAGAPPEWRASLCQVLTASARRGDEAVKVDALRYCPIESLALGLVPDRSARAGGAREVDEFEGIAQEVEFK